jgi:hypothetical protein
MILAIATSMTACVTASSNSVYTSKVLVSCPSYINYPQSLLTTASNELMAMPKGSAVETLVNDYRITRAEIKECLRQKEINQ